MYSGVVGDMSCNVALLLWNQSLSRCDNLSMSSIVGLRPPVTQSATISFQFLIFYSVFLVFNLFYCALNFVIGRTTEKTNKTIGFCPSDTALDMHIFLGLT